MHVDTPAEVMKVARYHRISPTAVRGGLRTIQVQYQQRFFRNGFHNVFPHAPCLHHPQGTCIERLEQPMYRLPHSPQVFGRIHRRSAFVKRIGGIYSVTAEQLVLLFQKSQSYFMKQGVSGIQLGRGVKTTPLSLHVDFCLRIFLLQLPWYIARKTLLNGLHAQFQLACDYLLSQSHVLVHHRLRQWTSVALDILHPLPCRVARSGKESPGFLFRKIEAQQGVIPHGVKPHGEKGHIDGVHSHIVQFLLPAFPVPPCRRIAHRG